MKILVTRPRAQSAAFGAALQLAGFEPVYFPVIEIRPVEDLSALEAALAELGKYAWVVFTSVNGVEIFFEQLKTHRGDAENAENAFKNLDELSVSAVKFAVVGKKTAEAIRKHGIEPFFVPEEFTGEEILPGLGNLRGKWVLLPRAELARKALPEAIVAAGGMAHELAVYRTLPAEADAEGLAALRAGVDWVTFTSPSTVQNFAQIARQNGLNPLDLPGKPKIACLGPVTEKSAREAGFSVAVTAEEYTTDGLIAVISRP